MKRFAWDAAKNEWLQAERRVSFEEVAAAIAVGGLLDILEQPNPSKYPNQRLFVVNIRNYVYLVPFVEGEEMIFLKTIIPSRKLTKAYSRGGK